MALRLVRADGGASFDLAHGRTAVVGRALECDIVIIDATISRRHAELELVDAGVAIRDLGSSNGTFVNGDRVDAANAQVGDVIAFGQAVFRVAAPRLPTPEGAATQIIVQLGGEQCRVAVLFSDIRGFSALSQTLAPEAIARQLSEYFTAMVACVFRNAGTLDKFIGDALMAQWGAPAGTPDDADRAVQAAIDMMEAVDRLNATWHRAGRPALGVGIGLSYGDVFAGHVGSEQRLEFTVIGDAVNTASRLCAAAEAGEILLSDALREVLRMPPPLVAHAPVESKGKSPLVLTHSVARQ